jgi:CO/xanthine dehydrogenase Mo-binding subunit
VTLRTLRGTPPHPVLADDAVRRVRDPIAFAVAETADQARGAAEAIEIDYEILAAPLDLAREGRAARHARLWGQAIMEPPVYDPISRQLLPGNLMDYALPHANEFPDVKGSCWRSRSRPIRWASKGADEAGAAGSPPTVINGIIDTMGGIGRMLLDMPTTPELVCRAMGGGESLIESVDGKTRKSKCPYIMS